MNLILLADAETRNFPSGTPAAEHLLRTLKIAPGETFWCGVRNGARGLATVREISPRGDVAFSVDWEKKSPVQTLPRVRLAVGLSRPQTMKKIFAVAAELGCSRIDVFRSEKSDPAYAKSSLWSDGGATLSEIFEKAAEQTCSTAFPSFALHDSLAKFLAFDATKKNLSAENFRVALDVYCAEKSLAEIAFPTDAEIALAIGSERGWTDAERASLRAENFVFAHLGGRVLRVETAVGAALSVALSKTNFWRPHEILNV